MGFWANIKVFQVTDIKGYNAAVGKLFCAFGMAFILLGVPLLEGLYRLYWILNDSLEIYFDLRGLYYFGPKKALKQLEEIDCTAARVYFEALKDPSYDNNTLSI